jgi:hypothetical protein
MTLYDMLVSMNKGRRKITLPKPKPKGFIKPSWQAMRVIDFANNHTGDTFTSKEVSQKSGQGIDVTAKTLAMLQYNKCVKSELRIIPVGGVVKFWTFVKVADVERLLARPKKPSPCRDAFSEDED